MTTTYHGLDESSALQPHLLEVSVDVEDAVLLRQLDVGVDGEVHAGAAGAVAEKRRLAAVKSRAVQPLVVST